MFGREGEFEAVRRLPHDPGFGLFGDVRGVIVEDHFDRCVGPTGGVEQSEVFDEFAAAMPIPGLPRALPVRRSMPASRLTVSWRLHSCSRAKVACFPGLADRSGAVVAMAWTPGFHHTT